MFHLAQKQYWKKLLHTSNQQGQAHLWLKKNLNGIAEKLCEEGPAMMDRHAYDRLRKAFDIRDVGVLKSLILFYGYGPRVRKAIEGVEAMYEGKFRKSGEPEVAHPLLVAVFAAATGGNEQETVLALLHDVVEDLKENPEMRYVHFEGKKRREIATADEMMDYVRKEFGDYVAGRLWVLTRKKDLGQAYDDYLDEVASDPVTDKLKKIDKICNLWDLDRIVDLEEKRRMVPRTLQKTWSQILKTKDDWLSEVLQYAWQGVVDWAMTQRELTAPRTLLLENEISLGLSGRPDRKSRFEDQTPVHEERETRLPETPGRHLATESP